MVFSAFKGREHNFKPTETPIILNVMIRHHMRPQLKTTPELRTTTEVITEPEMRTTSQLMETTELKTTTEVKTTPNETITSTEVPKISEILIREEIQELQNDLNNITGLKKGINSKISDLMTVLYEMKLNRTRNKIFY